MRDALLEAGASPEKASAAAEEVAGFENRLAGIDVRLARLTTMVQILIAIGLLLLGSLLGSQAALWFRLAELSAKLDQLIGKSP